MPPVSDLPAAYLALERERDALRARLDENEGTILDLKRQLDWLRRRIFGPGKGEKLDRLQLPLKLRGIEAELAAKAEAPRQEVGYERRCPKPEKRAAPAELYAKLPVSEVVVIEPAPARVMPGGHASAGLLAWVCIAKYLDHLPLYAGAGIKRLMPGGGLCRVGAGGASTAVARHPA